MGLFNKKSVQLSDSLNQATAQALDGLSAADEKELFAFAEYHPEDAEKTGFSGYSYWRSTLRVFTRNKMAMFCWASSSFCCFLRSFSRICPDNVTQSLLITMKTASRLSI